MVYIAYTYPERSLSALVQVGLSWGTILCKMCVRTNLQKHLSLRWSVRKTLLYWIVYIQGTVFTAYTFLSDMKVYVYEGLHVT